MIHALRVFRAERKLLTTVMEVFVKEPTIGWLQSAERLNLYNDEQISPQSEGPEWEPTKRLDIAVKKLSGGHPVTLIREQLDESHA